MKTHLDTAYLSHPFEAPKMTLNSIDPSIFREYDIRGIVGEGLSEAVVETIGLGFAQVLWNSGSTPKVVIGGDARPSSGPFRGALAKGLCRGGVQVIDIGEVSTPVLYFATEHWKIPNGIVITGSHNPPEYNGLKINKDHASFAGSNLSELATLIQNERLYERANGSIESRAGATFEYCEAVRADIELTRQIRVAVDCGNGITGAYAPDLYQSLGCEVIPLFDEVDGQFPNHHPDPTRPENLVDLIDAVRSNQADLGIAFDGDGDRVGVVTDAGTIIWSDRLLALFSQAVLPTRPNAPVVFDVKCSGQLTQAIQNAGGRPVMWKTGHTHIKQKLVQTNAILAAEFSGHFCFNDRWFGFDDGPYAGARVLELLSQSSRSLEQICETIPQLASTPELFMEVDDVTKFVVIEKLQQIGTFDNAEMTLLDGVRADYADGFGLARASNTSPKLTFRFEGTTREAIRRIHRIFARELHRVDKSLRIPDLIYV